MTRTHPIMLVFAVLSVALLQQPQSLPDSAARDTLSRKDVQVSVGNGVRSNRRREPKRIAVTDQHLATAFRTPMARSLLERARAARLEQDAELRSYDATAYFRISAHLGLAKLGRERLIFRHENATHVRWNRDVGAWIEVTGARTAIPIIPKEEEDKEKENALDDSDIIAVPYYPGQEPLFTFNGTGMVKAQVDERDMVHPLAEGAEAYYTYAVGDSMTLRLPDGKVFRLRELHVRPRVAKWNVAVGSLWFDLASGQLVRAAYRLAEPLDIWAQVKEEEPEADEDIPGWVKPLLTPMRAQVAAIAVEYGLYEGRFWLPRMRAAEGHANVSFARVPFRFEQSFRYASVNAVDSLPPIVVAAPDSSAADTVVIEDGREVHDSSGHRVARSVECDSAGVRTITRRRRDIRMNVGVRVPCDIAQLESSPDLPKSIYDDGEEVFGSSDRDLLLREAKAMGAQAPVSIGSYPPTLAWGLQFTRFNRIEGFSTGALVEQRLGGGYTASLMGRIGHADLEPNVELALARSNMSRTLRLRGYNRLVYANDWGNPLAFGSSLASLLFGQDDGFYFRATGAELEWARETGALFTWRLFAEQQRAARQEVDKTLGARFRPNVDAQRRNYFGAATRLAHTRGLDPNGFRIFTDLRLEGATSDSAGAAYGRGALDLTFTRAFGRVASALTLSGGSSVGPLPAQRAWFLGGAHTIRGQRADTSLSGNAFWMGRMELGTAVQGIRPLIFGDIGWTGDRERLSEIGRPMSGAGVGFSALDGLFRLDLARGIYPQRKTRLYLYLDAKF